MEMVYSKFQCQGYFYSKVLIWWWKACYVSLTSRNPCSCNVFFWHPGNSKCAYVSLTWEACLSGTLKRFTAHYKTRNFICWSHAITKTSTTKLLILIEWFSSANTPQTIAIIFNRAILPPVWITRWLWIWSLRFASNNLTPLRRLTIFILIY